MPDTNALPTCPVTLAPVILDNALPFPLTFVNTPFVAPILPTLALPLALNVPATLAPVPVTVKILALPATLIVTFAFGAISTLLLPSLIPVTARSPATNVPVTDKLPNVVSPVALNVPPIITPLPVAVKILALPETPIVTLLLLETTTLLVPSCNKVTAIFPAFNTPVTDMFNAVRVPVPMLNVKLASPVIAP